MAFPILNLPWLAVKNVLYNLFYMENSGLKDLESFADASKKAEKVVKTIRMPVIFDIEVMQVFTKITYEIHGQIIGKRKFGLQAPLRLTRDAWLYMVEDMMIVLKKDDDATVELEPHPTYKAVMEAVEKVLSLFPRGQVHNFHLKPGRMNSNHFIYSIPIDYCTQMTISGNKSISNQDLKMILEKVHVAKWIRLKIPILDDFKFDLSKISTETVDMEDGTWVNRRQILNARPTKIQIQESSLTVRDLESIVTRWMRSNDQNLSLISIYLMEKTEEKLKLDRFKPMELDKERRGDVFVHHEGQGVRITEGHDFERSDGLLATVSFDGEAFRMCVWHERFPNLDGVEIERTREEIMEEVMRVVREFREGRIN